jgi:hypothetical protein
MRKILLFLLASSMTAIGAYLFFMQLFFSPVVYLKIFAGSVMLVFFGLFLLWEDFIVPFFKIVFHSKRPDKDL